MLSKILFANPHHKKFIVKNFDDQQALFDLFEIQLFKIDYLVNFVQKKQQWSYSAVLKPSLISTRMVNISKFLMTNWTFLNHTSPEKPSMVSSQDLNMLEKPLWPSMLLNISDLS